MMSSIQEIATSELVTETTLEDKALAVKAIGTVDGAILADLRTFLGSLHTFARDKKAPQIVIDVRGLDFVSAAGFRVLVEWLFDVRRDAACTTCFVLHDKKPWQKRSLEPIAQLGGASIVADVGS